MKSNEIVYERIINPLFFKKMEIDRFLNSNGFFDTYVGSFSGKEIYHTAKVNGIIIGARKTIYNFQDFYDKTKYKERLKDFVSKEDDVYYLMAMGVLGSYRNIGVGSKLLSMAINDIERGQVLASLMESNSIKDKYLKNHGFKICSHVDNRTFIQRFIN